jgi:hypothetical protein
MGRIILASGLVLAGISCNTGPKELGTFPIQENGEAVAAHKDLVLDVHRIVVRKAVPTSKYLYLQVTEGGREYWVATALSEVSEGQTYFYNEALVKTDFESKEMGRVFDTLYLVTRMVPEAHGEGLKPVREIPAPPEQAGEPAKTGFHSSPLAGKATSLSIADLLADPAKYENQVVELKVTCTKVNEAILGRNWLHVTDGSAEGADLVVTSTSMAEVGENITLRAIVHLNRDFGAGYSYDVLLEDGVILP